MAFMNRRILIQVTAPAVLIGLLLFGTCVLGVWYINRSQRSLANIRTQNIRSLRATQELEISVRQIRHRNFLYLIDPIQQEIRAGATPSTAMKRHVHKLTDEIQMAHTRFEDALGKVRAAVNLVADDELAGREKRLIEQIEAGYSKYQTELDRLRASPVAEAPKDVSKWSETHPIQKVVVPCADLLKLNQEMLDGSYQKSTELGDQAEWLMLLLGLLGPAGGVVLGFGIARGLSRSIYQLSVRVQDMAHRLDQDVASVSIAADGDIRTLDRQLAVVIERVEEVAERMQRHQHEMLRAEQLSAVGQLAASVAHEVRNPLTGVKMLVEASLRSQNRRPLTLDDLKVIHGEIVRLEKTVQSFLDFARLPQPQRRRDDLRTLVSHAVELVQTRARRQQVTIDTRVPETAVMVDVDRDQFCTVLVNLFLNALDVLPHGGGLEVTLDATLNSVRLEVTDNGPGISPEIADRLFTPFASTKATGTGLGLSLSRRIVEEHGGRMTASNRPNGGACFMITMPIDNTPLPRVRARESFVSGL